MRIKSLKLLFQVSTNCSFKTGLEEKSLMTIKPIRSFVTTQKILQAVII